MNTYATATAADVKALRALKTRAERQSQGRYLAEGEHLCGEAIREAQAISLIVQSGKETQYAQYLQSGLPVQVLSAKAFDMISDTRTPQGIAALCHLPDHVTATALGPRIVALNGVQHGFFRNVRADFFVQRLQDFFPELGAIHFQSVF